MFSTVKLNQTRKIYKRFASFTEMLKQLDWETLELRRRKARLIMLYKMHCNLVEIDQQKYLEPAGCSRRHMHKFSYKVPASEINYHLYSFSPIQSGIGIAYSWMSSRHDPSILSEPSWPCYLPFYSFFFIAISIPADHLLRIVVWMESKYLENK